MPTFGYERPWRIKRFIETSPLTIFTVKGAQPREFHATHWIVVIVILSEPKHLACTDSAHMKTSPVDQFAIIP